MKVQIIALLLVPTVDTFATRLKDNIVEIVFYIIVCELFEKN